MKVPLHSVYGQHFGKLFIRATHMWCTFITWASCVLQK